MNGSLVPLRYFFITLGILVLIAFGTGHLYWNSHKQSCLVNRTWSGNPWFVAFSIGKLELRQHPYTCPPGESYDPATLHPTNGSIPGGVLPSGD